MRRLTAGVITLGLVLGFAGQASAKTTTTTIPTLRSPAGNLYRAGEFCSKKDLGLQDHGSDGIIKCIVDVGYDRWVKAQ